MTTHKLNFTDRWTKIVLDQTMKITGAENFNSKLFFGLQQETLFNNSIRFLSEKSDANNLLSAANLLNAITRAKTEQRNVFFEYTSTISSSGTYCVVVHIEHSDNGYITLYATEIDRKDTCIPTHQSQFAESETANKTLRKIQQKIELAMKASDIMLWEFDVKQKLFSSENEPINEYDESKKITPQIYVNTTHPDDAAHTAHYINQMIQGRDEVFSFDIRVKYPNNPDWQYCTVSAVPCEKDSDGKVLQYVGIRKNNTVLRKKQLLQENILNNIPLPIHIKDMEDNGRYIFCNQEGKRLFGTVENQIAQDVMDEILTEEMREKEREVFLTGKPYLGEEKILLKNNKAFEMLVRKSIIYDNGKRLLLAIRWDQSLQNELQRRSKMLTISTSAQNAFTWFYDVKEDRFSFSDGFEKTGGDAANVNSINKFATRIHPEDRQHFLDAINGALIEEGERFSIEYRVDLAGNGKYEWWECRGRVTFYSWGFNI